MERRYERRRVASRRFDVVHARRWGSRRVSRVCVHTSRLQECKGLGVFPVSGTIEGDMNTFDWQILSGPRTLLETYSASICRCEQERPGCRTILAKTERERVDGVLRWSGRVRCKEWSSFHGGRTARTAIELANWSKTWQKCDDVRVVLRERDVSAPGTRPERYRFSRCGDRNESFSIRGPANLLRGFEIKYRWNLTKNGARVGTGYKRSFSSMVMNFLNFEFRNAARGRWVSFQEEGTRFDSNVSLEADCISSIANDFYLFGFDKSDRCCLFIDGGESTHNVACDNNWYRAFEYLLVYRGCIVGVVEIVVLYRKCRADWSDPMTLRN